MEAKLFYTLEMRLYKKNDLKPLMLRSFYYDMTSKNIKLNVF